MINRKLIRVKIVQLTYAYYQNGHHNMDTAEKELLFSLSKAYDLYNYLLGLIVAITQEERRRVDIATRRAEREGTETPSQRFAFNKFATQLEENKQLNLFMEDKKMSWENDVEAVRKLCDQIERSPLYQEYMMSDAEDYETDRELWRRIYRTLIQGNEDLDAILGRRVSTGTMTRRSSIPSLSRPSKDSIRPTRLTKSCCLNMTTQRIASMR